MLARAESIRTAALAPARRERALRTLTALASQEPTSATHAESVRRAATAILKETRQAPDTPTTQPAPAAATSPNMPSTNPSANPALTPAALLNLLTSPDLTTHLNALETELLQAQARRRPAPAA